MVAFTKLVALVAAATAVSAWDFDIKFTRFSDDCCKCPIKTTNLHHNKCYDVGPGKSFESFSYINKRKYSDDKRVGCTVQVYDAAGCNGESYSLGDAAATFSQCGTVDFSDGAKSVSVTCDGAKPHRDSSGFGDDN